MSLSCIQHLALEDNTANQQLDLITITNHKFLIASMNLKQAAQLVKQLKQYLFAYTVCALNKLLVLAIASPVNTGHKRSLPNTVPMDQYGLF